jgi:hypothetical protein
MPNRHTVITFSLAIALVAAALAAYGFLLYSIHADKAALGTERAGVAAARAKAQTLNDLTRSHDELETARDTLHSYLLTDDGVVGFLDMIESLGRPYGATVSTAALDVAAGGAAIDQLQLQVRASGSHEAVFSVLALLETLPYQSYVASADIERTNADDAKGEWQGTFAIVVGKQRTQ